MRWQWPRLPDTLVLPEVIRQANTRLKDLERDLMTLTPFAWISVTDREYGADPTGARDSTAAFVAFNAALATGGVGIIPPGTYLRTAEAALTPGSQPIAIIAYGAVFITTGAIPAFTVRGITSSTAPVTVYGLKVNHRANASATYGFNIVAASVRLVDPVVVAHGVGATYAAIRYAQADAGDPDTGAFWGVIERPWIQKEDGADIGDIPIGIVLEGSANAVRIAGGGGIANCDECIVLRDQSGGDGRIPNAVAIDTNFETYGTAVAVRSSSATANVIGPFLAGSCRFEGGDKVFEITGITKQPEVPPIVAGMPTSSAGLWITNPNDLTIDSQDFARPVQTLEEEITLNTGGTTTDSTRNLLPANSIIEAVSWRVTTSINTAANWSAGDATTPARFVNASTSLTAGLTGVGLLHYQGGIATDAAGPVQVAAAKLRITTDVNPGAGKIRVRVQARTFAPAMA